jgi:ribose 5-phosphate isomerase A
MNLKQQAAARALDYVRSGMTLGLGTGATTAHLVDMLGERLHTGELQDIRAVPTSERTAAHARAQAIPLTSLAELGRQRGAALLDLAVDSADQVDPDLNLIKGLGRALLREKIVTVHADRFLVIVDESKMTPRLGNSCPLPIEIVPFEAEAHVRWLGTLGCRAELWLEKDNAPVVTDNGNYMARCWFPNGITDPSALACTLAGRPGIVEHGLFLGMADAVIVAGSGGVRILQVSEADR